MSVTGYTKAGADQAIADAIEDIDLPDAIPAASTTVQGKVELATNAETTTGTDATRAVTPAGLKSVTDGLITADASTTVKGVVELATNVETTTGTDTVRAVTPAGVKAATDALSLGTAATKNTGTASGEVPLLTTGGVLPIARLATGTPDGTKFVRDDGTLAAPSASTAQAVNLLRYSDPYSGFFNAGAYKFVLTQGNTATTTTAAVSAGAIVLPLASVAGLLAGVPLILNADSANQQIVTISSIAGNDVTVTPPVGTALANGAAVAPLWNDNAHLTNLGLKSYIRWWLNTPTALTGDVPLAGIKSGERVTLLGNSWFAGATEWATAIVAKHPGVLVTNAGISGNNDTQILARFDTDVPSDSKYVVINEPGVNNSRNSIDQATTMANLAQLVRKIRALGAVPVYIGPAPLQADPTVSANRARQMLALTRSGEVSPFADALGPALIGANGNVVIGTQAGLAAGARSTVIGNMADRFGTGADTTALGEFAGYSLSTGATNTLLGARAGQLLATGAGNTAVGSSAMFNATGSEHTGVGAAALQSLTTGTADTAVGNAAGYAPNNVSANATTTANHQTLIGAGTGQGSATARNWLTCLGKWAIGDGDYATALGPKTNAGAAGAVAIGTDSGGVGASTTTANEVALGTNNHLVKVAGRLNVAQRTPSSGADAQGRVGDIVADDNYVYAKTSTGWKRAALTTW